MATPERNKPISAMDVVKDRAVPERTQLLPAIDVVENN
jgi:hypothetical protein